MLKSWTELKGVDVKPFTETKPTGGKMLTYLPWSKCISLLHENGAEHVSFRPVLVDGSYLICSREVENSNKNNDIRKCGCPFVRIEVEIDDRKWTYDYPLLDGANVIYDDNLNQRAIDKAHKRAFVKTVAMETGLGWSLWAGEDEDDAEDLSYHNIRAIQKRMQEKLTALLQRTDIEVFCKQNQITQKNLNEIMTRYFNGIAWLESKL